MSARLRSSLPRRVTSPRRRRSPRWPITMRLRSSRASSAVADKLDRRPATGEPRTKALAGRLGPRSSRSCARSLGHLGAGGRPIENGRGPCSRAEGTLTPTPTLHVAASAGLRVGLPSGSTLRSTRPVATTNTPRPRIGGGARRRTRQLRPPPPVSRMSPRPGRTPLDSRGLQRSEQVARSAAISMPWARKTSNIDMLHDWPQDNSIPGASTEIPRRNRGISTFWAPLPRCCHGWQRSPGQQAHGLVGGVRAEVHVAHGGLQAGVPRQVLGRDGGRHGHRQVRAGRGRATTLRRCPGSTARNHRRAPRTRCVGVCLPRDRSARARR